MHCRLDRACMSQRDEVTSLYARPFLLRECGSGYEFAQSTVAKYMAKHRPGSGQTWKTFLHNHAAGIGAMDFLVVPTIGFRLLFVCWSS